MLRLGFSVSEAALKYDIWMLEHIEREQYAHSHKLHSLERECSLYDDGQERKEAIGVDVLH